MTTVYKIYIYILVLVGFHAGPLSWSNWNLEILIFLEGGKPGEEPSEQGAN